MTDLARSDPSYSRFPSTHGGPDAQGAAPHDFSTNANAYGPCASVVEALRAVDATHYPDPAYTALRRDLAMFHGVAPQRIVMAASASEFIFRITAAVARSKGSAVCLPRYSYGDYEKAASAFGLTIGRAESDDASLVWLCDPSSPLGLSGRGLGARIDSLPPDATCVLDLAYEPLRLEGRLDLDSRQRDRVWQMWTPNKALGLTGIRAAYAIAPRAEHASGMSVVRQQALLDCVDALSPSWPVGAHGVALLENWTQPATQAWMSESRVVLRGWKAAQVAMCSGLGWLPEPSVANFFCIRPANADVDVETLVARLRASGIKVRDAASFGLPGHLRLAVRGPESQEALARGLR